MEIGGFEHREIEPNLKLLVDQFAEYDLGREFEGPIVDSSIGNDAVDHVDHMDHDADHDEGPFEDSFEGAFVGRFAG